MPDYADATRTRTALAPAQRGAGLTRSASRAPSGHAAALATHRASLNGGHRGQPLAQLRHTLNRQSALADGPRGAFREPSHGEIDGDTAVSCVPSAARPVVQRLPVKADVVAALGSASRLIQGNSTYRALLRTLVDWHRTLDEPLAETGAEVMRQLRELLARADAVIGACDALTAVQPGSARATYAGTLKLQAQNEKTAALGALMRAVRDRAHYRPNLRVGEIIDPPGAPTVDQARHAGTVGGGMNTLDRYSARGVGRDLFFKPNMASMDVFSTQAEEVATHPAMHLPPGPARDAAFELYSAKLNRTDFSAVGGISATDTRSAAREVATYRLDQLLGAGVSARTMFALRADGVLGTAQRQAPGSAAGDLQPARDAEEQARLGADRAFRVRDPNLLRLLSRLQLLDALALQLDRHAGNYFLELHHGEVIGLQGIDNDMSFGTRVDIHKRSKQYSGMSRFVDRTLAERILALEPDLLRQAMADLLSREELDALLERLHRLQIHLAGDIDLLPAESDWTDVRAQAIEAEQRGYQYTQAQRVNPPAAAAAAALPGAAAGPPPGPAVVPPPLLAAAAAAVPHPPAAPSPREAARPPGD